MTSCSDVEQPPRLNSNDVERPPRTTILNNNGLQLRGRRTTTTNSNHEFQSSSTIPIFPSCLQIAMQAQHHTKTISSGREGHGVHVCHKCGWPFPNPHPSAKNRRAHKKICGTIDGYKLATSGESKANLDDEHLSDGDSKRPSLKVVKKVAEMTISRKSSSGVESRSSRSTRSDEDVFSDAVADFAVVGDLYLPNIDNGTQLQNVESSRPENERVEINMPSEHNLSRSAVDSISNSRSSVQEASVSESALPCSKVDAVLDSEVLDKKAEVPANIPSESAGQTSEAVDMEFIPAGAAMEASGKKVDEFEDNNDCCNEVNIAGETNSSDNGTLEVEKSEEPANIPSESAGQTSEAVDMEFIPAVAAMEASGKQVDEVEDNNDCYNVVNFAGESNSSENGTVEVEKSEDTMKMSSVFAGKTPEAVSVPQMWNGDNLENLPASMEVTGSPGLKFDAKNDCVSQADFDGQINSMEEKASKVEADSYLEMVVPDALPVKEPPEDVLKDYEYCKTKELPDAVSLDLAQEVECVDQGKHDVNKGAFNQEDDSSEVVSTEKKPEVHTTNADINGSISAVFHQDKDDNEVGQSEMITSPQEKNSLVFVDTKVRSVLDDSGDLTHCIEGVKPARDDLEHDKNDTKIFDASEASNTKVVEENLPLTSDSVDFDARSREVEEKLSQSNVLMDDKVEVQIDDNGSEAATSESKEASLLKCDSQMKKLEDSEATVTDLGSSRNQIEGGECVDLLGATVISGIGNNANMTEASDSVDVSLFNNAMNNDARPDKNEAFKDAKDLENIDEKVSGEECFGKVDLDLITGSDDSPDLNQNTSNKTEARVNVEAVSAVEDHSLKKNDGSCYDFVDRDGKLVKQEEVVPELDVQIDSISQTDSLEGNWGSISVLSAFSDAPAATETGSQPSQTSPKVEKAGLQPKSNNGKSDIFEPQYVMTSVEQKGDGNEANEGAPEAQTSEKPLKKHMSLKSFLGDSSSPNAEEDNLPVKSQETEKMIMGNTKEPEHEDSRREVQKEWNSPARYLTNIKREKGKVKSKPYWAPFVCCSSVQTS